MSSSNQVGLMFSFNKPKINTTNNTTTNTTTNTTKTIQPRSTSVLQARSRMASNPFTSYLSPRAIINSPKTGCSTCGT